jgi:internalin A
VLGNDSSFCGVARMKNNKQQIIFHKALNLIERAYREDLEELDLSNLRESGEAFHDITKIDYLAELPARIADLRNLRKLNISRNKLTSLPAEIGQLKNLVDLNASDNQIGVLPFQMGELSSLVRLDLGNNHLAQLPSELCQLTQLRYLNLSGNVLSALPTDIGQLRKLEILLLGPRIGVNRLILPPTNRISNIPASIRWLEELRELDLSHNNLRELPPEIRYLRKLRILDISHNNLTSLPTGIVNLPSLEKAIIQFNPLPIPPEILEDGNEAIVSYYFPLIKENTKPLGETKVLFVGQGSVGKTSLIRRMIQNQFIEGQSKTDGISINQWSISRDQLSAGSLDPKSSTEDHPIKLNIWDFGGQEIMHATHQFFLTKRSLYVLVLDARLTQEENRVEYWLKIIHSFSGGSPVIIVGNKTDQHPLDIDRTGLRKKYPNIVAILETSAATGAGLKALKSEIAEQVENLPHIHDQIPETWFTVKLKLEELAKNRNFFTLEEYLDLCDIHKVTDETSQRTLISFLHDLGVVLHFQDDPRLEALGILNPQWVTNGVYRILNSHELFQNRGTLTLSILNRILDLPAYPSNKRLFIVDMMKKFELCYDIEADKSFLVPDLLPKDEPYVGEWDKALAFQFQYNVLPSSIITRFIVRMNAFVHRTVWRTGVVLKRGQNTALVKADTEERKIDIWVSGDQYARRDFLSAIRMEFDAIHKTIARFDVAEKVPVPDLPRAIPIDYEFLLHLERKKRETIPVQIGNEIVDVNVRDLINGVRPPASNVFVSYSRKDKIFAKRVARELEKEGVGVWWDFESLEGGQDWQTEITKAIRQCDFFVVVLTPSAIQSEWVGNEIAYALQTQRRIIPLYLKKCDIPIGLVKKQFIDFEKHNKRAALKELLGILKAH